MNSRERVLRALKIKDGMPDRIPIQFDLCRQLQDHFGKQLGIESKCTITYLKMLHIVLVATKSD